jgi:hypothetical protein
MPRKTTTSPSSLILKALPPEAKKRVIYLEEVDVYLLPIDPRTIEGNPKNWRVHTQRQRSTYNAFKEKYGFLAFPIYNLKTSRLLDGHMRVEEAIKEKREHIYVILKYLEEHEENEVLATFDNIGLLAKRDNEALKALTKATQENLKKITSVTDQKLAQLTKDLHSVAESDNAPSVLLPQSKSKVRKPKEILKADSDDDAESDEAVEYEELGDYTPPNNDPIIDTFINGDVFFEGTSWLDIPQLDPNKLSAPEDAPSRTYVRDSYGSDAYFCVSSGPFEEGEPIGTLGFYTEDHRFEDAYRNPESFAEFLQQLDPTAVLTPDFSTYAEWPTVLSLYSLYRSRWCGRFWQELGFNIIPSLQNLRTKEDTITYVLETLPDSPVLALQCRKSDIEGLIDYIKMVVSVCKPQVLVLYGGEEKQKYLHGYLPKKVEYRYLMQYTEKRRRNRKRNE